MSLITWNSSLSVGIAEIDEQHAKLIGILNNLHEAMRAGKSKEILGQTLQQLIDYTVKHFATEEKYFDKFNYAEGAAHKAIHKDLAAKALDYQKRFQANELTNSVELMNFLSKWLNDHIKGADTKYTKCFKDNGLK